jgi:hypothetical protein
MSRFRSAGVVVVASVFSAHCATPPGMPPDFLLPVQKIVLHSVCELRFALRDLTTSHPSFLKTAWAISITLTPKIDTDAAVRAGLTGKSTSLPNPKYFNNWSIVGNAPGAGYDTKGHTDGTAVYLTTSAVLLDKDDKHPLYCDTSSTAYNTLTQYLGIRDWLERTAAAAEGSISGLTKLDKPTYNNEITITVDAGGSFTYNYPFGTNFLNALGSYKLDESVAIAFVAEPVEKKVVVRTLPSGAEYSSTSSAPSTVSAAAKSELGTLGLQQQIINLQTSVERRR